MYLQECPEAEIKKNIEALKYHLTTEWVLGALGDRTAPNIILPSLDGRRGLLPFSMLMSSGRMLRLLHDASGLSRKVEELKGRKSLSTYFEIQIGSRFADCGYEVSFLPETRESKCHDIDAIAEEHSFAIECKRLDSMAWEKWGEDLTRSFMPLIAQPNVPSHLQVQIELDPGLSVLRMEGEAENFTRAIANGIREEIAARIKTLVGQPGEAVIPGVAVVRVLPIEPDNRGSISGFPISPHAKMRHILQNGILRGLKQLPSDRTGVIAIFCDFPPMAELIRLVLDSGIAAQRERFSSLAAVVLFPMQFFSSATFPQLMYVNRESEVSNADLGEIVKVFENTSTSLQLIN